MQIRRHSFWLGLVLPVLSACSPSSPSSATPAAPTPSATTTTVIENVAPGVVELSKATAKYGDDNIVYFEIAYKFTSGSPVKHYQCDIQFPGTNNRGFKPMESWELKPEGVIKTGIQVLNASVKEYSITFAEADSPDRGYKLISNTLTGTIEQDSAAELPKTGE